MNLYFKALLSFLFIPTAFTTQFNPDPFPHTLTKTPTIVRGVTGKSYSEWVVSETGDKQLFTFTELNVKEVLKGKTEHKKIKIREIGGEKDGLIFDISGTVKFKKGEDVVLMLGESLSTTELNESFAIQNMSLGKLSVEKKSDGTEILKGGALIGEGAAGKSEWTISDVKNLIEHPHELEISHDQKNELNKVIEKGLLGDRKIDKPNHISLNKENLEKAALESPRDQSGFLNWKKLAIALFSGGLIYFIIRMKVK